MKQTGVPLPSIHDILDPLPLAGVLLTRGHDLPPEASQLADLADGLPGKPSPLWQKTIVWRLATAGLGVNHKQRAVLQEAQVPMAWSVAEARCALHAAFYN